MCVCLISNKCSAVAEMGDRFRIVLSSERTIEPRPHVTRTENFLKFGRVHGVLSEICVRTERHTALYFTPLSRAKYQYNKMQYNAIQFDNCSFV